MSNVMVAFITAVSAGAWIYTKVYHRTGGARTPTYVATGVAAAMVFIVMLTIMSTLF